MSFLCNNNSPSSLNILQWNVRSLPARSASLQRLLAHYKCSVAIISETWLLSSRTFNIPHFNIFRCDRHNGSAGSTITVHKSIKSRVINLDPTLLNRFTNKKINIVGIELLKSNSSPSLFILSCDIPSDTYIPMDLWQLLFNLISPFSLLCGDFNSFHPSWGSSSSSSRGVHIYDTISSLGLCILNNGNHTLIGRPGTSDSAIDLFFSSPDLVWNTTWPTLDEP